MGIKINEICPFNSIVGSSVECLPAVLVPYVQCMSKTEKNSIGGSVVECSPATRVAGFDSQPMHICFVLFKIKHIST